MRGEAPAAAIVAMMSVCVFLSFASAHWVLSSWFARRLHGWQAFLFLAAILGVMCLAIVLVISGNPVGMLVPLVPLGVGLVGRAVGEWADRRQRDSFDQEDVGRYQAAIAMDPGNVAAHSLLADVWRKMGKLEEAIKEYQAALDLDHSLKPERYWLEQCRRRLEMEGQPPETCCPRCGARRGPGQTACPACGRPYSLWETWAYAFQTMDRAHRAVWMAVGAAGATLVIGVGVLAPGGGRLLLALGLFGSAAAMLVAGYCDRRRRRDGG